MMFYVSSINVGDIFIYANHLEEEQVLLLVNIFPTSIPSTNSVYFLGSQIVKAVLVILAHPVRSSLRYFLPSLVLCS
jgi:hypothetical protein